MGRLGYAGVYRFFNSNGELLYIGNSINVFNRLADHFRGGRREVTRIGIEWFATPEEAAGAEVKAILAEQPKYNRRRWRVKLTAADVREIRRRYTRRCPVNGSTAMAREFGVGQGHISAVARGKSGKG